MKTNKTQHISDVLDHYLKKNNIQGGINKTRIMNAWYKVLGTTIEKYTSKLYVSKRTLYVTLSSSLVRSELLMMREKLIKNLNEEVGASIIDDIVIR